MLVVPVQFTDVFCTISGLCCETRAAGKKHPTLVYAEHMHGSRRTSHLSLVLCYPIHKHAMRRSSVWQPETYIIY